MNKKEVLRAAGFSEEYLKVLDEFAGSGISKVVVNSPFIPEQFNCLTTDTSELYINETIIKSSTELSSL